MPPVFFTQKFKCKNRIIKQEVLVWLNFAKLHASFMSV